MQNAERPDPGTESVVGRAAPIPATGPPPEAAPNPPTGAAADPPTGAASDLTAAVRAAQDGDEAAFRVLFRTVQPGLLRYLRVLVAGQPESTQDAEDIASEAWLQIARDLHTFTGDGDAFRGWAATVARHRALDHLRARRRRPVADLPFEYLVELAGRDDTAGSALSAVGTSDALALISRLPRDQAEAVLLRVVLELDAETAARVLGKRSGAVRMAAHRGLRGLAKLLERTGPAGIPAQAGRGTGRESGRTGTKRGARKFAEEIPPQGVTERRAATLKDMR
ncbi:RNA polymerase sigma factor [Kitasatospora sp. NPDC054939]